AAACLVRGLRRRHRLRRPGLHRLSRCPMMAPADVGVGETSRPGLAVTAASLPEALVTAVVVHGAATNRGQRVRRTKAGEALARWNEAAQTRAAADAIAARRDHGRHRFGAEPAPAVLSSAPASRERADSRPRGRTSRAQASNAEAHVSGDFLLVR